MLNSQNNEKLIKAASEKQNKTQNKTKTKQNKKNPKVPYKGKLIRINTVFSLETLKTERVEQCITSPKTALKPR